MTKKTDTADRRLLARETGTLRKQWQDRIRVALVYPNQYHVGMSNLGFQTVYRQLNRMDAVVCERAFLPAARRNDGGRIVSLESGRRLTDFDIIAFSISFENDYPNLLKILEKTGIPLRAADRGTPFPLIAAGGVACFLNPEPLSLFVDCFLLGEAETLLPRFITGFDDYCRDAGRSREACLAKMARQVPGFYAPALYRPHYHADGTLDRFEALADVPETIERVILPDLSATETCSAVVTPETTFADTYLIEVSRGCPHGCRFCSAGFVYRPPRFRPLPLLEQCMQQGAAACEKIGLVGAAVSDLPWIGQLCSGHGGQSRISFSSLRADALAPELVETLQKSGVKTATIAPDAGSERLRRVINKGIDEADVLSAAEILVAGGIPNIKLYFMVGLPTETPADVEAIVSLCKKIKHRFLQTSRGRGRIGDLTLSLNCFVPKPFTPFQWAGMDSVRSLKNKIKQVKNGLKQVANVRVNADVPRWAYVQALLSRGDRRVAELLLAAHARAGNWPQTFKSTSLNPDFYVGRERPLDERFPWDFIDGGVRKAFLKKEYRKALRAAPSPACPMHDCVACGACKPGNHLK